MQTTHPTRRLAAAARRATVPLALLALVTGLLANPSWATSEPQVPEAFEACLACHSYGRDEPLQEAPPLWGVVGRGIASVEGFDYSPALKALAGSWDRARLDRFLANPKAMVPGTRMKLGGIADPVERSTVLDFLEQLAPTQPASAPGE